MILKEIDVFVFTGLVFLFTYSLWGIDISVGAMLSGGVILSVDGIINPVNYYHAHLLLSIYSFLSLIGWILFRIHYDRWKNEPKR